MDLKIKRINWVGNICQKLEAVCQEVDNIVSQDAVKYLESQVQNVGGSVKNFYSGVVQELLPLPPLVNSAKHEALSVALKNKSGSSVKSDASVKDDNKKGDEESTLNNSIETMQDSNAIDLANDQQDQQSVVPIKHDLVNQVSDETCLDSLEVDNSYITQDEIGDDHSRETSEAKRERLHVTIEEVAVESAPQMMHLISVKEKETLEFLIHSESSSGSCCSGCGVLVEMKDNLDVNVEQNSYSVVEKNATSSSTSPVLNFVSLGEEESFKASFLSEPSDVDKDTRGILYEVSPAASTVSCESPMTKTGPSCFKSSTPSDSLYSKSLGSYAFEIESYKNNSGDLAWCISDSSLVHVCCEPSPPAAGQVMESQGGLVSSGHSQSVESIDESAANSIESSLEDIQLNDDTKLEESCVFVEDSELHAVSCRAQKLRSYKKRIQDAFASKKRLAKEYEQLAIWYGDTDLEPNKGSSRTLSPFSSRTYAESKNLQGQHASETEWELL